MTYKAGDDATRTYPVTDTNGGTLAIPATVTAHNSDGTTVTVTAAWQGAATAVEVPDDWPVDVPVPTRRNLEVELVTIPAGLWGLSLSIDGAEDLFLGNVYVS